MSSFMTFSRIASDTSLNVDGASSLSPSGPEAPQHAAADAPSLGFFIASLHGPYDFFIQPTVS